VEERLREAMIQLEADPDLLPTPSLLARLAGVSRNTLYANHRPLLEAVRLLRAKRERSHEASVDKAGSRARHDLEQQLRLLATQNAGLLQRAITAERRSARLEARNAELVRALDAVRKPAIVPSSDAG